MRVVWTPEAEADRELIWEYIASDSLAAAARMDELFDSAAQRLTDFPESGRPGRIAGTRELIPHENYRLVYEISSNVVWILALVHTSRMWPPVRDDA
ncbi:type II toxin-antitoxin system mRNA interferase toxin, RelE/StbE family [Burkholderia sp. 4701]|nr:type II toxin-antitoxin system mRNA interferase toxin, RelE/StbE family [Burkholderia sp. 4701]MXN84417.1 type II toxin-antitoxin system mRNA interferase toxin, RelE/StbE family [Burkholderia sp. 4812]